MRAIIALPYPRDAEVMHASVGSGLAASLAEMEVAIRGETIRLGQLLKLVGAADGGGEAKAMLGEGVVTVNGRPDTRRGRQLHPGDEVAVAGSRWTVVSGGA